MGFQPRPFSKALLDAVLGYDVDVHASRHGSAGDDVVTPAAIAAVAKTGAETIEGVKSFDAVPKVKTGSALYVPVYTSGRRGPHYDNSNWIPADMLENVLLGTASIIWASTNVTLQTGTDADSVAQILKGTYGTGAIYTWDRDRYWAVRAYPQDLANCLFHIVCGSCTNRKERVNLRNHVGFKADDDHLYATVADGANETEVDLGTFPAVPATLELKLFAGVRCEFYWDGPLVATITTNLPSGDGFAFYPLRANIYNKTDPASKRLKIYEVRFDQE